jgi:hypothetical protein
VLWKLNKNYKHILKKYDSMSKIIYNDYVLHPSWLRNQRIPKFATFSFIFGLVISIQIWRAVFRFFFDKDHIWVLIIFLFNTNTLLFRCSHWTFNYLTIIVNFEKERHLKLWFFIDLFFLYILIICSLRSY